MWEMWIGTEGSGFSSIGVRSGSTTFACKGKSVQQEKGQERVRYTFASLRAGSRPSQMFRSRFD